MEVGGEDERGEMGEGGGYEGGAMKRCQTDWEILSP